MRRPSISLFILGLASTGLASTTLSAGVTSNWVGPNGGLWNSAANWSAGIPGITPGVPNGTITTARGTMTVNLDVSPSMGLLTIGAGCTLVQPDNRDLALTGLVNDGIWSVNSGGNLTDIRLNANLSFSGSGAVELGNHGNNRIYSINVNRTLTNGVDHTIRGAGSLGNNNTGLVNDGIVEATLPAGLYIDLADNMPLDNNNLLRARDGSTLTLYGTNTLNDGGVIRAEDASTVFFRYGSVTGGTLETIGTGEFRTTNEDTTFADVTLNGLLRMPDNADSVVAGTITNNGTWSMESSGNLTDLRLNSTTVTLTGPGVLAMGNHGNNRIVSINVNRTLVNDATHTIRGAGQIGNNNTGLVNEGIVEATLSAGLFIDLADNMPLDNNHLLRARDGSTLTLYGTNTDNAGGVIRAEDGSVVSIRYGSVTGGVLETTGSGEFRTTNEETTFADVTLNGLLRMPDNADSVVAGTITNNGTWSMESGGNLTDLRLNTDTVTLTGPGVLAMGNHGNNRIVSINVNRMLVNAFGHTIRGGGQIGVNNTGLQNKGLIEADQPTGLSIDLWDSANNWNQGIMRVSNSGGISLLNANFQNFGLVDIQPTRSMSRTGTYQQVDGETRVNGTLTITSGNYAQTGGLLTGDGQVTGSVSMQGGSTSPSNADGSEIGSLVVTGTYSQGNDGGYVVDLGLSGNDHLQVNGAASLGGAIQVRLVGSFLPMLGQEFVILDAASVNGVFGCVEFPNAPAGYFTVVYGPTSVKLVVAGGGSAAAGGGPRLRRRGRSRRRRRPPRGLGRHALQQRDLLPRRPRRRRQGERHGPRDPARRVGLSRRSSALHLTGPLQESATRTRGRAARRIGRAALVRRCGVARLERDLLRPRGPRSGQPRGELGEQSPHLGIARIVHQGDLHPVPPAELAGPVVELDAPGLEVLAEGEGRERARRLDGGDRVEVRGVGDDPESEAGARRSHQAG